MWNVELSGLAKKFWVLDGREGRDGQGSSEFWVLGSELEADKKSETRAIRLVYLVCFV